MAPVDGGLEGLLPGQRRPAATGQDREAVAQPLDQLVQPDRPQSHGGQLERQGHTVKTAAEIGHQLAVGVVNLKLDAGISRPLY